MLSSVHTLMYCVYYRQTQHEIHGGRCGVCGDEFTESGEGEHVAGGAYANGVIGRTYQVGQVIDVIAEITANHLGWMEFHICANNDPGKKVSFQLLCNYRISIQI